jgi:hypothetical protein
MFLFSGNVNSMLCNTLSISFKGVKSHEIIDKLCEKVAISAGFDFFFYFLKNIS